ncbi:MAG TPA: hypothetical protein DCG12_21505 [Planctomycetaceae bacterium]|nr:hypothetical protein [Planctomycetaceae bacterium]
MTIVEANLLRDNGVNHLLNPDPRVQRLLSILIFISCSRAQGEDIAARLSSEKAWLLGENINLELVLKNSGPDPVTAWQDGDRESPVPLRFRVQAFDESGEKIPGLYVGREVRLAKKQQANRTVIRPDASASFRIPLLRFCDITSPGRYRVVVEYRFSEEALLPVQKISDELTDSPKGVVRASCQVEIILPNPGQMLIVLGQYQARLQFRAQIGRGPDEIDLTTFRFRESLPALPKHFTGLRDGADEQILEAIRLNRGPESINALLYLTTHAERDTARKAFDRLSATLAEQPLNRTLWSEEAQRLAVEIVTREEFALDQLQHMELSVSQQQQFVEHIIRSFGTLADAEGFARTADSIRFGERFDFEWHADLTWHLLCDGKGAPSRDTIAYWAGVPVSKTPQAVFMLLCHHSESYRPWGWMNRWNSLMMSSSPQLRAAGLKYMPTEIDRKTAFEVQRSLQPAWQDERVADNEMLQLAAIGFVKRSGSSFFVPTLMKLARTDPNRKVSNGAREALRRCIPGPYKEPESLPEWPPVEISEEQVSGLILGLRDANSRSASVDALRKASGLDFGDAMEQTSFSNWNDWWQREKVASQRVGSNDRDFVLYGRVTDVSGEPIPGAWVRVYLDGITSGSLGRVAYTLADLQGRYIVRFGFPERMDTVLPTAFVRVRASDAGRFACLPWNESSALVASRREVEDDSVLQVQKADALYPGEPREMNFTLHPETQVRVNTRLADGTVKLPHRIQLRYEHHGKELGQFALWTVRDEYHFIHFVTGRTARIEITPERGATPLLSDPIHFDRVGRYTFDVAAESLKNAKATLNLIPVNTPHISSRFGRPKIHIAGEVGVPQGTWQAHSDSAELMYTVASADPLMADGTGVLSQRWWSGRKQIGTSVDVKLLRAPNGERRIWSQSAEIGTLGVSKAGKLQIRLTRVACQVGLMPMEAPLHPVLNGQSPPRDNSARVLRTTTPDMIHPAPKWGREREGLQLGIRLSDPSATVRIGQKTPIRLYLCNSRSSDRTIRLALRFGDAPFKVSNNNGEDVSMDLFQYGQRGGNERQQFVLAPGEVLALEHPGLVLIPEGRQNVPWETMTARGIEPGLFRIQQELRIERMLDETTASLIFLKSGSLAIEVVP